MFSEFIFKDKCARFIFFLDINSNSNLEGLTVMSLM